MGKAVRPFKTCYRCKRTDPPEGFYANGYCKPCGAAYYAEWRSKNREKSLANHRAHYARHADAKRAAARDYGRRLKLAAIAAYGDRCACCSESRHEFLAIDHIGGGGNKHRKEIGVSPGHGFYRWLKRQKYPAGFRVLCHNCNVALGMFGYCPHARAA